MAINFRIVNPEVTTKVLKEARSMTPALHPVSTREYAVAHQLDPKLAVPAK